MTFVIHLLLPYVLVVFASLFKMTFDISLNIFSTEKLTCVAVFIISDDKFYNEVVLEELVVEKLALIPDHTKFVVSPSEFKSIAKVPETLHVKYLACEDSRFRRFKYRDVGNVPFFTWMVDIFKKRWQTLNLISMMQELQRTVGFISIKDSSSSLPAFQKKEVEHSS